MQNTTTVSINQDLRAMSPTALPERINAVDVVRGFALLGILLVNMAMFGMPVYQTIMGAGEPASGMDAAATWLIRFVAEGKFYSLFSMLFGFGLYIMMTRSEARGVSFVPLYVRRLLVLLAFGLIHAVFFWIGDILVPYALLGFLLLLFRQAKPRTLLIWTALILLLVIGVNMVLVGLMELGKAVAGPEMMAQEMERTAEQYRLANEAALHAYGSGSFGDIMSQRFGDLAFIYSVTIFILPNIFAMFLVGLYIAKRGVLQDIPAHLSLFKRVLVSGLIVGVIGNLMYAFGMEYSMRMEPSVVNLIAIVGQTIGAPALAMAYASALILILQKPVWEKRLAPLASVGRMALSNYFFQTIVCTTIFYSYGLGMYGKIGAAAGIVLSLAIYFAQIPLSVWWLKHFRFGPMEWLWRSLTYGKWQPMRLEQKGTRA